MASLCLRSDAIREHLPLVRRIAHTMLARLPANVELDDLLQAGTIALWDALERFDAGRGASLETFAGHRIRGAILDELRATDHLGRNVRAGQRQVDTTTRALEQRLCRRPMLAEVAAEMRLTVADCDQILVDGAALVPIGDVEPDAMPTVAGPEEIVIERRLWGAISAAVGVLPDVPRDVMIMVHDRDMSMTEIAAEFGTSVSAVSQSYARGVERLRERVRQHL